MSQTNYRDRFSVAIAGMIDGTGEIQGEPYLNSGGFTAELWTVTTPAIPADNTLYSIEATDVSHPFPALSINFTTGVGTTRAQLAAGLYAAARADLQFNGLLLIVNNTSTLTLTHRKANTRFFPVVGGGGAAPLTIPSTPTVAASAPGLIGFGLGLIRIAGGNSARLPVAGDTLNSVAGFTIATGQIQKDRVGEGSLVGYEPGTLAMNVLQRCGTMPGIWVATNETTISPDTDLVYLSVAPGFQGYVQKTSANSAIDLSAKARFRSRIETSITGQRIVKVQADF